MEEVNKVPSLGYFFFGDGAWSFGSFGSADFSEFHATGI